MDNRRMCPNCRAFITTDDRVCPYCELKLGPRAIDQRSPADILGGLIPHRMFTTMVIMLVNTGLYIATVLYAMRGGQGGGFSELDLNTLRDFGGKDGYDIFVMGQYWRLITAGFLHGGLMHILMNMYGLFYIGPQVEEAYGTSRYVFYYLVSSAAGFLASAFMKPNTLSIGASAGIFGLVGAMIAFGVRDRSSYGAMIRSAYTRMAIFSLGFGFVLSLAGIIDNWAHVGGIAAGFALGYLGGTPRLSRGSLETFWRIAAGAALAVTALSFVIMFLSLTAQSPS